MMTCVAEFLLELTVCLSSRWSSLSAPLFCSSVHVDTTEIKQLKSIVIMSYCLNVNSINDIVLFACTFVFAYLSNNGPPEINR